MPDMGELKRQLNYDPNTGYFSWKINKKGPAKEGSIAGARHRSGYLSIRLNGIDYLAHRLAWFYFYGEIGDLDQVDHINLNRSDNRIENLRKATHGQNSINTRAKSHNKSGLKGAHFDKRNNLFRARIVIDGKQIWLGYFATAEEAHAEYCRMAAVAHGSFHREK